MHKSLSLLVGFLVLMLSFSAVANKELKNEGDTLAHKAHENKHSDEAAHHPVKIEGAVNTVEEIQAYKDHHLLDAHDFTFFTDGKEGKHYGFPLPVILWDSEAGLQMFMSSKFHHGEAVAENNGNYYAEFHGKIYKTNAAGELHLDEHGHPTNAKPIDFSITKNVVGMLLTALIMMYLFIKLARSYSKGPVPTGVGRALEPLVLYVRDEIARPNIGDKRYREFMGFLLTVFFFIWILNLLGMTPLAFNVTGNIAVTLCLALFTFIIVQFKGNKEYWGHIFWMPGIPTPMKIVLAPIEVLGMFTKPFSLTMRLFANITAGHMVIMSLISLVIVLKSQFGLVASSGISFVLTLFISLIELLVAFLQAFIFTMLSSLFIGLAVAEHDHH